MPEKDDVFENWSALKTAEELQTSLDEQEALRQAGDPKRLALDQILAQQWGIELEKTGEPERRAIEDHAPNYAIAAK